MEIQKAIRLHCPRIVDAALSLAETQEEMLEEAKQLPQPRYRQDYSQGKNSFRSGYTNRGILSQPADEQKKVEEKPPWSDQMKTLKAQSRARGECFKCGEKYQPGHKCAKTVSLNVVEELLELLQLQSSSEDERDTDTSEDETLMKISYCASVGTTAKKTIKLHATINGKHVLVLVDSGSSGSFISQKTVDSLQLKTDRVSAVRVMVADGAKLPCDTAVPEVIWHCQNNVFSSTLRVFD
jgi:hypothetical protein